MTCPRCGCLHAPIADVFEIRDPDDEAVACGFLHIERMDLGHVWLAVDAPDGRRLVVNLHSIGRIRMTMEVEG